MSSSLTNILLIARREYLERVRARSFMMMTILIPAIMAGLLYGASLMKNDLSSSTHVAIVTDDAAFVSGFQAELNSGKEASKSIVDVHSPRDPNVIASLNEQLKSKEKKLDGYLVVAPATTVGERPKFDWVPRVKSDAITRSRVADAARAALWREQLAKTGASSASMDSLLKPVELSPDGAKDQGDAAIKSAYGMYFLMYFVILFYGMNVARSIIEEKTSRVFEVLLATIKPEEMLAGKVIGVGAVGLTQVGIWIVLGVIAVTQGRMGANLHILPSAGQMALFVVFFLLGYLLYSSIAASLGAMNNSEQELQQMQMVMMLPLIISSGVIWKVTTDPDGMLSKVFSFIPFTTPLIMYTRVIVGKPGPVAVGISIAALILTIAVVLWIASRIYRVGILMYGKKPNLPEIMRWLKYS